MVKSDTGKELKSAPIETRSKLNPPSNSTLDRSSSPIYTTRLAFDRKVRRERAGSEVEATVLVIDRYDSRVEDQTESNSNIFGYKVDDELEL